MGIVPDRETKVPWGAASPKGPAPQQFAVISNKARSGFFEALVRQSHACSPMDLTGRGLFSNLGPFRQVILLLPELARSAHQAGDIGAMILCSGRLSTIHSGAQLRDALAQFINLAQPFVQSLELAMHKARVRRNAFFHSRDAILGFLVKLRGQRSQQSLAQGFHPFLEAFLGLLALVRDDEKADNRQDAGRQYAGDVKGT